MCARGQLIKLEKSLETERARNKQARTTLNLVRSASFDKKVMKVQAANSAGGASHSSASALQTPRAQEAPAPVMRRQSLDALALEPTCLDASLDAVAGAGLQGVQEGAGGVRGGPSMSAPPLPQRPTQPPASDTATWDEV